MACVIEDVTEQIDQSATVDKYLGDLLIAHKGDTQKFLTTVFDFLKRKTNFLKGADPKKRVLDAYKEVSGEGDGFKTGFFGNKPATKAPVPAPSPSNASAETSVDSAVGDKAKATVADPPQPSLPTKVKDDDDEDDKPKGLKPTAARGAVFSNYSWGQTLGDVNVTVPVPKGTRARELEVVIGKSKLKVGVKGQAPILDGELSEPVKADDCMWEMVDDTVDITLYKQDGMHWWKCVLKGDPEIDTQKVEPENSKLGDLDAETRQTVEKMMFDQRQKAMGLPSSEEMKKQEMMKKFMEAHPEMDFSGAKMM